MSRTRTKAMGGLVASTTAAWLTAALLGPMPIAMASGSVTNAPVVRTDKGDVRGAARDGVDNYLGLRYAKAPVRELRWRPPQPVDAWTSVADATTYGNKCAALPSTNGPLSVTEDCLFLNVQRPAGTTAGARLPVYVFIHGGGNVNGSSNQHDGASIVAQDGIIVVTMNYRLGVFGWFAHPALTAEQGESGNYGFQDIEASLAWVHRNIAAFGGDPSAVTIGGESAGAVSVCALLTAPAVQGMFAAAMMQSGGCGSQQQADAEGFGNYIASAAGCSDPGSALACLRSLDTTTLLDTANNDHSDYVSGTPTLPTDPWSAVQTGAFAHVPLVVGANRDEGRTFTAGDVGMTKSGYKKRMRDFFGGFAKKVLERYPWPAKSDQFTGAYLTGAVITDSGIFGLGGCWNRQLASTFAASTRVWVYEFNNRKGPGLRPDPVGYVWGAGHAAELAYLWPSFDNGTPIAPTFTAGDRQLARDMVGYWGGFVRNANDTSAAATPWVGYNESHQVLSLRAAGASRIISDRDVSAEHQCDFWG